MDSCRTQLQIFQNVSDLQLRKHLKGLLTCWTFWLTASSTNDALALKVMVPRISRIVVADTKKKDTDSSYMYLNRPQLYWNNMISSHKQLASKPCRGRKLLAAQGNWHPSQSPCNSSSWAKCTVGYAWFSHLEKRQAGGKFPHMRYCIYSVGCIKRP